MTTHWNGIRRFSASLAVVCSWAAGASLLLTAPAQAYIDPGSGSMFLQLLLAAIAGGLWTLKVYWRRLKDFFSPGPRTRQGTEQGAENVDSPDPAPDPGRQE